MIKKVATWLAVGFLVFFVATRPAAAATATKSIGTLLAGTANGFGEFFTKLFT